MKAKAAIQRNSTRVQSTLQADTQVYGAGLTLIGVAGCAIGLWAFASMVGGIISSGGPMALAGAWLKAAFGI